MSRTYAELIDLVRRWSNRDIEVLPNTIIADAVRYAADKAYRTLRVPPLEHTVIYDSSMLERASTSTNNRFSSVTELAIPTDLVEFIQIRGVDSQGRTTRMFNEKADVRTFNDIYAERYNDAAVWTRQGNCILLAPAVGNAGTNYGSTGVGQEETIELYYYRRLPALHARFDVSAANANLNLNTVGTSPTMALSGTPEVIPTGMLFQDTSGMFFDMQNTDSTLTEVSVYGNVVPNWLRDENERVVLMGALAELFFYLQENDEATKYAQLFLQEIDELNKEDQMRNASGGNVQVNYNGRGLI